ncbi:OTU domain-containing protein 3-like [Daphnia pulicaria]|uniref:OTU domain-containing protein 3-like n=1 Tax=Daphnia pulicaria TaxID=35523 RepID=UPI001EEB207F|nr:OTU domain-containing protein 3-like [Daphnia pulicaria]
MARKKEDNGKYKRITNKSKKSSRDSKDVDADVIKSQLITLGLTLREVPGDGNCLFRALGDQLDGHMGNHYRHRQDTTTYMLEHRDDFQPFVEDDLPFEKHISELSQPGTYAGNDAIVAFARLHQVTIVIHQPNAPLWQIRGWESSGTQTEKNKKGKNYNNIPISRQLHIAYHGGDHYDSVRRLGDTSHIPANIQIDVESEGNEVTTQSQNTADQDYDSCELHEINRVDDSEANEIEREAILRTGCQDLAIVRQLLYNNCGNLEAAVEDLLALSLTPVDNEEPKMDPSGGRSKSTFSRKQLERIRKQERKRAGEARRKPCNTTRESPEEAVIIGKVQCLNI